jgi:hypothetical protein
MKKLITIALLSYCLSACTTKVYLTRPLMQEMLDDNVSTDRIQIFTDETFAFNLENKSTTIAASGGTLKVKKASKNDETSFQKDLACKIIKYSTDLSSITVLFEDGHTAVLCPLETGKGTDLDAPKYRVPTSFDYDGQSVRQDVLFRNVNFYILREYSDKNKKNVRKVKGVIVR